MLREEKLLMYELEALLAYLIDIKQHVKYNESRPLKR